MNQLPALTFKRYTKSETINGVKCKDMTIKRMNQTDPPNRRYSNLNHKPV